MDEIQETKPQQSDKKSYEWLKPYQFKVGNNANPGGRPKGSKSLKTYAREYLESLPEEEKIAYLNTLDRELIWKMAEGNPKNDLELAGKVTFDNVINEIENGNQNDNRGHQPSQEVIGQIVADIPVIQNPQQEQGVSDIPQEQSPSPLPSEQMVEKYNPQEPTTGIYD